jgi:CHAD domain-containing protein
MTQSSIYYYKPNKFMEYIKTITNKSIGVPEALGTFRELKVLPKEFKTMTVQHLADKTNKILDLFTQLRSRMEPESPKLPYSKKQREQELINELA